MELKYNPYSKVPETEEKYHTFTKLDEYCSLRYRFFTEYKESTSLDVVEAYAHSWKEHCDMMGYYLPNKKRRLGCIDFKGTEEAITNQPVCFLHSLLLNYLIYF